MRRHVRIRWSVAALCCFGVLLVAAMAGRYAQLARPGEAGPSRRIVFTLGAPMAGSPVGRQAQAWRPTGPGLPSDPTTLHQTAQIARTVGTTVWMPGRIAPALVLFGLALVMVVVRAPVILRPCAGARRHRTRAPPLRA